MTGLLPDSGLLLNPDAAHPPFAWHVALPQSWAMLDTHPATWERSLERLVDDRLAGQRLKSAERRELLSHLADLVASAQQGGVLISLVQIGTLSNGAPASAGLHLAWYDSSPQVASLATVRKAVGRQGVVEEIDTEAGTVLLQRDRVLMAPPGSATRHEVTSLQAFLPLAGRTWTAVVATSSAHPELTDALRELVLGTVASIHPVDDVPAGRSAAPDGDGGGSTTTYAPVEKPSAPGIERGFGTMVLRRIEPPDKAGPS